jgi:crotonobetainyl-CoA:carnitine CoA-transferase CaiB-like acyl-CoA transferase
VALAGATQTTAARLFAVIGKPELIEDPRFNNNMNRIKNVVALDKYLDDWMGAHTFAKVASILRNADVPFGPVNNIADIARDAHAIARRMIVEAPDEDGRLLPMEGVFPRMVDTPGEVRHAGKSMGADNDEIYFERLGLSKKQFADLTRDGIV